MSFVKAGHNGCMFSRKTKCSHFPSQTIWVLFSRFQSSFIFSSLKMAEPNISIAMQSIVFWYFSGTVIPLRHMRNRLWVIPQVSTTFFLNSSAFPWGILSIKFCSCVIFLYFRFDYRNAKVNKYSFKQTSVFNLEAI